ncbi:MAG: type II secretion system protein PulP [Geobacter sp.]|nr:MAG: type II secretion system protein PulP [Geobacter sp.]
MSRQRLILLILLILLVATLIWSYLSYPRLKTVSPMKYPPGSHLKAEKKRQPLVKAASSAEGRSLRLDLLNKEQASFKGYRRDIFKPVFIDELKVMKQMASVAKPALPPAPAPKTAPVLPVPTAATGTAPRELARFTFLGFLKKNNQKTIFLAKDKDIILVKKGETFAGRYQAASITDQALTILVTDTGEEIVIPLIENRPLSMASK